MMFRDRQISEMILGICYLGNPSLEIARSSGERKFKTTWEICYFYVIRTWWQQTWSWLEIYWGQRQYPSGAVSVARCFFWARLVPTRVLPKQAASSAMKTSLSAVRFTSVYWKPKLTAYGEAGSNWKVTECSSVLTRCSVSWTAVNCGVMTRANRTLWGCGCSCNRSATFRGDVHPSGLGSSCCCRSTFWRRWTDRGLSWQTRVLLFHVGSESSLTLISYGGPLYALTLKPSDACQRSWSLRPHSSPYW